jgi:type II secretory pathway pseudopilin PulG
MNTKQRQSGFALPVVVIILAVITVAVSMMIEYSVTTAANAQRENGREQAIAAANGALENLYIQWRAACIANQNVPISTSQVTQTAPTMPALWGAGAQLDSFLVLPGGTNPLVTYSLSAISATDPTLTPLASTTTPPPSASQNNYMTTFNYLAEADVSYQTVTGGTSTVKVCRIFQKTITSPWQYACFYNDYLEINPRSPDNLQITGQVQTNGNLYTGGGGNGHPNALNFGGQVNFSGTWTPGGAWSPSDTFHLNPVTACTWSNMEPSFGPWVFPVDYNSLNSVENPAMMSNPNTWDGYREIIERPRSGHADPMVPTNYGNYTIPSQRMYNQAGVRILITTNPLVPASTVVQILDNAGNVCTSSSTGTDLIIYNTFHPAIATNVSMYDSREGQTVLLTTLNINQLLTNLNGTLANTGCNVVYISDFTANNGTNASGTPNPTGACNRGIQLINGYAMPTGGLTIVSDNPVYILGDYNTSAVPYSAANHPPSDSTPSIPTMNSLGTYVVQPCAIMADAVTALSNGWTNANSVFPLSSRNAISTTYNTALLAGIVPTGTNTYPLNGAGTITLFSGYSGGAENYLRMLENWSGQCLTYYGSMVELFPSIEATSQWRDQGVYYTAPTRQFYLNNQFLQTSPPGIFAFVKYSKARWFLK